jgi:hypothetical protein
LALVGASRFIVHTSAIRPASSKRRQMIRLPSGEKNGPPSYPFTFVSLFTPEPSASARTM